VWAERVASSNVMIGMINSKQTCATKPNVQVALDVEVTREATVHD
jgi:hypothetical protein